jgi:hypothetical protein
MYVLRIENDNGVGFMWGKNKYTIERKLEYYYIYDIWDENNKKMTERWQHPDADEGTELQKAYFNKLIYRGSPLRFGFATSKDLYTWISPAALGVYELNGYYIYVYEIPEEHVIKGTRQVAFDPKHSTNKYKISHRTLRRNFKSLNI